MKISERAKEKFVASPGMTRCERCGHFREPGKRHFCAPQPEKPMSNEDKKPALNPVQPPNKLSEHEHSVWLSTYQAADLLDSQSPRMMSDNKNYAELRANAALDAYRKKCLE